MPATFQNETAFREWICTELRATLPEGWHVVMGRNVADILVSWQDLARPLMIFLEVKYHKKNHGRIGIGNGEGTGYQPEYLLNRITYLENHLRWVVGDESLESALILTNDEVRKYAAGGIRVGKQNNFQNNVFTKERQNLIPMAELPTKLVTTFAEMIANF